MHARAQLNIKTNSKTRQLGNFKISPTNGPRASEYDSSNYIRFPIITLGTETCRPVTNLLCPFKLGISIERCVIHLCTRVKWYCNIILFKAIAFWGYVYLPTNGNRFKTNPVGVAAYLRNVFALKWIQLADSTLLRTERSSKATDSSFLFFFFSNRLKKIIDFYFTRNVWQISLLFFNHSDLVPNALRHGAQIIESIFKIHSMTIMGHVHVFRPR